MNHADDIGQNLPIGSHHYRAYVGPPEKYDVVGAMQFNLLTHLGLREFHYMLDVGCGSLRAGRLFIPYLLPGHYYGIEPQSWLIEEGIKKELGRDLVQLKQPVFSYDANFNCIQFNQKFDFVIAQSIFSHASQAQIHRCLSEISRSLQPSGLLAATFVEGRADYQGDGWVYPECVTFTLKRMKQIADANGLTAETIDWPHPNGQTWLLIRHRKNQF